MGSFNGMLVAKSHTSYGIDKEKGLKKVEVVNVIRQIVSCICFKS